MDIRKKVEHAFPREEAHVTVQFESFCHFVNLKWLPDKLNSNKQTHQSTESDLNSNHSFRPDRETVLHHAKRKIKYLSDNHYTVGRTVNIELCSVHNMKPCITYPRVDSKCWGQHKKLTWIWFRWRTTWGGCQGWPLIDCTMPTHGGSSPL